MSNKLKTTLSSIALFSAVFISAVMSAGYVVDKMWSHHEHIAFGENILISIHNQTTVGNELATIELLDNNNLDEIYKKSCRTLVMYTKFINPELYNEAPKKKAEIQELKENAFQAIEKLKAKGYCNEITLRFNSEVQQR